MIEVLPCYCLQPSGEVVCVYMYVCIYTHIHMYIYTQLVCCIHGLYTIFCVVYAISHTQIVLNGLKDKPQYYKREWQVDWLSIVQSEKTTFILRWCHRVNVKFPSPQFMLKPSVRCDGIWRCLWEVIRPRPMGVEHSWMRSVSLETPASALVPSSVWGRRVVTTVLGRELGAHQTSNPPAWWSWPASLQN